MIKGFVDIGTACRAAMLSPATLYRWIRLGLYVVRRLGPRGRSVRIAVDEYGLPVRADAIASSRRAAKPKRRRQAVRSEP